jgi:hypothetical protein
MCRIALLSPGPVCSTSIADAVGRIGSSTLRWTLPFDFVHHRRATVRAGADNQPATVLRNLLRGGERGYDQGVAESLRRLLAAFADLPAVDHDVVLVGHVIEADRTEAESFAARATCSLS